MATCHGRSAAFVIVGVLIAVSCAPAVAPPTPRPAYCPDAATGSLHDITATPAGPYFVHHPSPPLAAAPIIVFLPGGAGLKRNAQRAWDTFLDGGSGVDAFRVVVPYWPDLEMSEDFRRTVVIVDEVIACYGGDVRAVHLAGFSNGGHAAFDLMLERPERFATLLGAPGEFRPGTGIADVARLAGRAVFNGVGERDDEFWHRGVREAHELLLRAGVESVYVEFAGQGHGAGQGFPRDVLFTFWSRHTPSRRP